MRPFTLLLFLLLPIFSFGQYSLEKQNKIDSLNAVVLTAEHDSTIVKAWRSLDFLVYQQDSDLDLRLNEMVDSLCQENLQKPLGKEEQSFFQTNLSYALNAQGLIHRNRGDFDKAIDFFTRCVNLAQEIGRIDVETKAYGSIGRCFLIKGDYDQASVWYQKALDRSREAEFTIGEARAHMFLGFVHKVEGDYDAALEEYQNSLEKYEGSDRLNEIANVYGNMSQIMIAQGDLRNAIIQITSARQVYERVGDMKAVSNALAETAGVYMIQKDYPRALAKYEESLAIATETDYKQGISLAWSNIGSVKLSMGDSTGALNAYEEALTLNELIGDGAGKAFCLNKIGNYHRLHGDLDTAMVFIRQGLVLREEIGNPSEIASSLIELGNTYLEMDQSGRAISNAEKALALAQSNESIQLVRDASEVLYEGFKLEGNTAMALEMHELFMYSRDSINSVGNHAEVLRQEYQYDYEKRSLVDSLAFAQREAVKDLEIENQRVGLSRQRILLGFSLLGLLLLLALGVAIYKGKKRSDTLLHNILPEEVARELKATGQAKARNFEEVTILFTDFVGFTKLSAEVSATELVQEINTCFSAFDGIIEKYGLEKIKTIGDAYMAAGGLPKPGEAEAKEVIMAGLEMQAFMLERYREIIGNGGRAFQMRAGIHTGPAVAGIVGVKKFQYDIWGDTVNIASRMESYGEINKVNISQATFNRIHKRQEFNFESRGKIEVKGKGEMEMFFVQYS